MQTVREALSARENVVMVRLNKESVLRLDELVDAGLVNSRSEAAAFLIAEGIKSRAEVFERIAEKIDEIRRAKAELRDLLNEPDAGAPAGMASDQDTGERP
jgi:Arc/MetJ-type ribon-helix-helix transcriptional regulator